MSRHWPFVGRERELGCVERALADGELTGVVLVGPPGVGKTRLARTGADRAEAAGAVVRWVKGTSSASTIPLGAMSHLLSDWDGQGFHAASLLPHAARHLIDSAGGRRIVLVADDAHLLDPTSAALVHHLAVARAASVVVTARTGVSVPDPIFALWKEGLAERVDLHGLDRARSDELVCQVLGGQVDGATLHHLWELSLGNTLFLRELVEGGLDSGALSAAGVWRWNGPMIPSPRLTDLIDARMGSLERDEQAVLELLAFGEPLGVDTLEHAGDAAALDAVERKGLITSERVDPRVELRLAHPLYGEVLRRRTSPRREKEIQRELAESLERSGLRRPGDRLRAVTWRLAAGLPTDADMLRDAAEDTMRVDCQAAERLARAAVERGGGFAATMVLSRILVALGRPLEAEELFAGLWFREEDAGPRSELAVARVANLSCGLGRLVRAATVLQDAAPGDLPTSGELATLEAALLDPQDVGDPDGPDIEGRVLDLVGTSDDRGPAGASELQTLTVAAAGLRRAARHEAALRVADRTRHLMAAHTEPLSLPARWARLQTETGRCEALALAGRLDEAERAGHEGYEAAVAGDDTGAKALHAGWLGVTFALQGRMRTALRWLRDATAGVTPDALPALPVLWTETLQAAVVLGEHETATAAARQVRRVQNESGDAYLPWAELAGVWLAVRDGRAADAVRSCFAAADHAERDGLVPAGLVALHTAVRLGADIGVADRLAETALRAEGPLVGLLADHGRAWAKRDGRALDEVARRFADLGVRLYAAEASAQAAVAHRAAGDGRSANVSALWARRRAAECEGARTPALAEPGASSDLTPREYEVATLAAAGMTSRAIAEHLVVSVRTVDNALYVVYGKLGLRGRRDLAAVLVPDEERIRVMPCPLRSRFE